MKLAQTIFGLAVVWVITLNSCDRFPSNFNSTRSNQFSKQVILHATGGDAYSLVNGEGVGLVYGNVTRILQEKGALVVKFESFDSPRKISFVRVDTNSGKVLPIKLNARQVAGLKDVESFFWNCCEGEKNGAVNINGKAVAAYDNM